MRPTRSGYRRRRWMVATLLALALVALLAVAREVPQDSWREWVQSLPAAPLLLALTVLPVIGFPISALHVATGARFSFAFALAAVAVSTVVHLGGSFLIARWLHRPAWALLGKLGWKLHVVPARAAWPFTLWIALLPGIPYTLKNYIPPLGGVAWRVYFATAFPLHVLRAPVGLALGHIAIDFSWPFAAALAGYAVIMIVLTRLLARRFREAAAARAGAEVVAIRPDADPQPAEGGRR